MRSERRMLDEGVDAIELLRAQHREIDQLLVALTQARAASSRASVVAELGDLFAVHFALEERVLYPGLLEADDGAVSLLAVEDHMGLKRLLAELLEMDAEDGLFTTLAERLRIEVREHVRVEEKRVLPAVRRRLPPLRLRRLAYEMRVLEFELRIASNPRLIILADARLPAPASPLG
jgi:hypothetical protein